MDRTALLAELAFDHRASIVRYMEEQATAFEVTGRKGEATALRATASSVAAQIDIRAGRDGIASPVAAIIYQVVAAFGGVSFAEIVGDSMGTKAAQRVRTAAMWVAKKRLGWSDERFEADFHRERSTFNSGVRSAEQRRDSDPEFKRITDNLLEQPLRCENCQHPLVTA